MPERQEQQATVAGLVPAALRRLDQPFNLAPGQVLPVDFATLNWPLSML
jgi:hypothetical protein